MSIREMIEVEIQFHNCPWVTDASLSRFELIELSRYANAIEFDQTPYERLHSSSIGECVSVFYASVIVVRLDYAIIMVGGDVPARWLIKLHDEMVAAKNDERGDNR